MIRVFLILLAIVFLLSGCEFWSLSDKDGQELPDGDLDGVVTDGDLPLEDGDIPEDGDKTPDGDEDDIDEDDDESDSDDLPDGDDEPDADTPLPRYTLMNGNVAPGYYSFSSNSSWGVYGGFVTTPRATESTNSNFTVTGQTVWNVPEE